MDPLLLLPLAKWQVTTFLTSVRPRVSRISLTLLAELLHRWAPQDPFLLISLQMRPTPPSLVRTLISSFQTQGAHSFHRVEIQRFSFLSHTRDPFSCHRMPWCVTMYLHPFHIFLMLHMKNLKVLETVNRPPLLSISLAIK